MDRKDEFQFIHMQSKMSFILEKVDNQASLLSKIILTAIIIYITIFTGFHELKIMNGEV